MMAFTEQALVNAEADIRYISDVATLPGGTATNRLGAVRKVLAQVLADIEAAAGSIGTLNPAFNTVEIAGGVPNSPYLGGIASQLQVNGLVAFSKTTNGGEHRLESYWDGNNAASLMNRSNNDGYSAWRFLTYDGREAMAVGYGNPGTVADLPFAAAGYIETSSFINADGSPNNGVPPRPLRFVLSGYMSRRDGSQAQGVYGRMSLEADGSFNYYHLDPRWSFARPLITFTDAAGMYTATFYDHEDTLTKDARMTPVLRVRRKNYSPAYTYDKPGVVIGKTYEGTPQTGGVPPAQVALDVGGTGLFGSLTNIDRAQNFTANGNDFALATAQGNEQHLRLFKPNVGKIDFLFQHGGMRGPSLAIGDPDNANKTPFAVSVDGKQNVFVAGAQDAGGGSGMIAVADAVVTPTNNPVGGIVLYSEAGVFKVRTPAGVRTVTVS